MKGLLLVLVFISSCSEDIDRYHWFQGDWISDAESTIRANPKFLEYSAEDLQAVSSIFGDLNWKVEQHQLKVGEYPEGYGTYEFEITPVSDEEFKFISQGAGNFTVRKTTNGFCVEFDIEHDSEPTITHECFESNDT